VIPSSPWDDLNRVGVGVLFTGTAVFGRFGLFSVELNPATVPPAMQKSQQKQKEFFS
jgi:hypothetical protein